MAIPRKGSRPIDVDGVSYRWLIRRKPTPTQALRETDALTVAVERVDVKGCTLLAAFPQARPDNWLGAPAVPVTPADVAEAIRAALKAGWQPEEKGSAFRFDVAPSPAGRGPG